MSTNSIDLNVLELDEGKNPFELLASKIEMLNLLGANREFVIQAEQAVLYLERKYQDLQEDNKEGAHILIQAVNANLLMVDNNLISGISDIAENLKSIRIATEAISTKQIEDVSDLSMVKNMRIKYKFHDPTILDISNTFKEIFTNRKLSRFKREENWQVELNFKTIAENNHFPLDFIHTFIEGLNTIDGVKVTLENIQIGSIRATLKFDFEDGVSKDSVKEVLNGMIDFASKRLAEDKNDTDITDRNGVEDRSDENFTEEGGNSIFSKDLSLKNLEVESLKYDIEKKKIENDMLRLKLLKQKKDILKELLADGLIAQKELEIIIKGIPFLEFKGGVLSVKENIDVIDKL